ncbi:DUF7521 family protein [Halorubrum californiense]
MISLTLIQITELLTVLQLLLGLVIVTLAAYGYRRNTSQPMLFLGIGIAMMTLVSTATTLVSSILFSASFVAPLSMAAEVTGMSLILYAVVLARRK